VVAARGQGRRATTSSIARCRCACRATKWADEYGVGLLPAGKCRGVQRTGRGDARECLRRPGASV